MHRRIVLLLSLLMGVGLGCDILNPRGPVEVRVRNGTDTPFDQGIVYVASDSIVFSALGSGEATPYREVDKAYRIATAQVVTGTDTARLQVIDYVGEEPLEGGRYTYVLGFFEGNPTSLTLDLTKER
jgi:hypothetical protein